MMIYSARFTIPADTTEVTDDQLVDMLDDDIQPFVISVSPGRWDIAIPVDSDTPGPDILIELDSASPRFGDAIAYAWEAVAAAAERHGLPVNDPIHVEFLTDGALEIEEAATAFPELLGVTEIAETLGVSRQRAGELSRRRDFPEPVARLAAGPVWTRPLVEHWQSNRGEPKAGRPAKAPAAV